MPCACNSAPRDTCLAMAAMLLSVAAMLLSVAALRDIIHDGVVLCCVVLYIIIVSNQPVSI